MPFDDDKFYTVATQGDVARVAVKTALALAFVREALEKIQSGGDFSEQIAEIDKKMLELDEVFDDLTGWTPK